MRFLDIATSVGAVLAITVFLVALVAFIVVTAEQWLIATGPLAAAKGPDDGRASQRDPRGAGARLLRAAVVIAVAVIVLTMALSALVPAVEPQTSTGVRFTWAALTCVVLTTPVVHGVVTWRSLHSVARWWDRVVPVTSTPHDRRRRRVLLQTCVPLTTHDLFVMAAALPALTHAVVLCGPGIVAAAPETDPLIDLFLAVFVVMFFSACAVQLISISGPRSRFVRLVLHGRADRWSGWLGATHRRVDVPAMATALWRWERRELRRVPPSLREAHALAFHQVCEGLRLADDTRHTRLSAAGEVRTMAEQALLAVLATDHRLATRLVHGAVPTALRTTTSPSPRRPWWAWGIDVVLARLLTVLTVVSCVVTVVALVMGLAGGGGFADTWKDFRL